MDMLQYGAPGSHAGDAGVALGLIDNDVQKHAVSALVNGLLGGPLGKLAAVGDAEDTLQAALPQLRQARRHASDLGAAPRTDRVPCAGPHSVPTPQVRLSGQARVQGFARSAEASFDLEAYARSLRFRLAIQARLQNGGILGRFAADLPRLSALFTGGAQSAGVAGAGQPSGNGDSEMARYLNDPNLSFEDKLFYFMLLVAQKQEKKMLDMMHKYDVAQARKKKQEKIKKSVGQAQGMIGMAGSVAGMYNPGFSIAAQQTNSLLGLLPDLAEGAQGMADDSTPDPGPGSKNKLSKEQREWSEQRWTM